MYDISGHFNHAQTNGFISLFTATGNGATVEVSYLEGNSETTVLWPIGSIPPAFTICSITRYVNQGKMRYILAGKDGYWIHGHYFLNEMESIRGLAVYKGLKTSMLSVGVVTDWLVLCGKNGGSIPNNILVDGIAAGVTNGGEGNDYLGINLPLYDSGDWAFRELMIWNTALSDEEMRIASNSLWTSLHGQVCILMSNKT